MMAFKFLDDEERQAVARLHAEIYRRAREGEITIDEMERLAAELLKPYRNGGIKARKARLVRQMSATRRGQPYGD